ncbi:MAG: N-6 DNA methylase, partial [Candidatus Bathyarchaeia archaeon]
MVLVSARVTERTLYEFIGRVFDRFGWRCFPETGLDERFPDLVLEGDGTKVVGEVKIDSEIQLTRAIIEADQKARRLGTRNALALLFPSYVRDIPLSELERNYPRLRVSALILTDWLAERRELTLEDLAETFTVSFRDWLETRKARVSYDLVVDVARDSIREIAGYLRQSLSQKPVLDSAMAVVGRFDIYKSLLEDFSGVSENEARLYIADITAYILVNQLLFYHIVSERLGYDKLPDVDPLNPPRDFLDVLETVLSKGREAYPHILGFNLFPVLRGDLRIVWAIARVVSTLKALRPQHIKEDLFGRLYHETIPPETRKNLGAFYTKPEAAKLLAALAIDRWDAKVLDPACGSGTLLVEAYQLKAALAPPMDKAELHRRLVDDIWGIDVMHFASHMTSMNLTAQNIEVPLKPHVLSQDGIKTMIESATEKAANDPPTSRLEESLTKWLELMRTERIPKDFDVVIMNPPFTRRERIPAKKEDLEKLVPEVKGKTGYWAYFVVAADKLLKENGTLALVIPEEFFAGSASKSVRNYLLEKSYQIRYIVRSTVELAFSESALYRDYLIILKRAVGSKRPLMLLLLDKKLEEIQVREIIDDLEKFLSSLDSSFHSKHATMIKITDPEKLLISHIGNWKPLVGFNTLKMHLLVLELLDRVKDYPTLESLENQKLIRIRVYNPGQYKTRGVEGFSRKLFASKFGSKSPNIAFVIQKQDENKILLQLINGKTSFYITKKATIPSLRTYSQVQHMDVTNEEEVAIVDLNAVPEEALRLSGFLPVDKAIQAANDIKSAYQALASNLLLVRRVQLSSPQLFWLAFYSDHPVISNAVLLNAQTANLTLAKTLTLYLNSVIATLQLLAFVVETRGTWVDLHGDQVWSHLHVPVINKLKKSTLNKALQIFADIGKFDVKPLFWRIKEHDPIQRVIDELALEMLGLEDWKPRLDEIYDALAKELETMHKILETSRRQTNKTKAKKEKGETA